jgi:cytochrome c5
MSFPRHSIALLTFALFALSVILRTPSPVEAETSAPLASIASKYLTVLHMPPSLKAELQVAATPTTQPEVSLPEGKGKDVTQRVCSTCHGINVFVQQRHTREKWSAIIDNMVSKGLDASDEDLATITDYLATNLGPPKDAPANPLNFSPRSLK